MPDRVTLSPARFAQAFPFHIAFDRELRLIQTGRTMLRLDASMVPGSVLSTHLRVRRPEVAMEYTRLAEQPDSLFLLEHLRTGLTLRGQVMLLNNDAGAVFLGSPWFTDPGALDEFGLGVDDFAIHDPVVDLLQLVQAQKMALTDQRRLADTLTRQRTELREVNRRLGEQNDALARASVRLRAQEAETRKLALVAARTDNAVIITDPEGRVEWVNEGFTRLTGYTIDEMRGRTPGSVLQSEETDPATVDAIRERLKRQEGFSVEIANRAKNGRSYWVAIEMQPIHDEHGRLVNFMAVESDITQRRQSQRRLALQYTVTSVLAGASRARDALPLVEKICDALDMRIGAFWEMRSGRCTYVWCTPELRGGAMEQACTDFRFDLGLPNVQPLARGEPMWVADLGLEPGFRRREAAAQDGLRGGFALPIQLDGRTIAVLEFAGRVAEQPSDAMMQVLRATADQLSDFAARMRDRRELKRMTDEFEAIFSLSPSGLVAFHQGGHTISNDAMRDLTGFEPEALRSVTEPAFDEMMSALCAADTPWVALSRADEGDTQVFRLATPRHRVLARSVRAMKDAHGATIGRIMFLRDITHETEVDRMKSEFLSTAAHELRTPMASIHGFSELLLAREFDDDTRRDLLETIHKQSSLLVDLVNDLLDLARIEARGAKDFRPKAQPLVPILREAIGALMVAGDARKVSLEIPDQPPEAEVDADRLHQAILNVLSNAYKYSPGGGPIHARIVEHDDAQAGRWVGISVRDEGIGMSPEQVGRLFERFYRADPSGAIPGTGLGMSLVADIMELMGGRVDVKSALGRGTEITLWLRACACAQEPGSAPKARTRRTPARPRKAAKR